MGSSWAILGLSWADLGLSWGYLRLSRGYLGLILGCLGASVNQPPPPRKLRIPMGVWISGRVAVEEDLGQFLGDLGALGANKTRSTSKGPGSTSDPRSTSGDLRSTSVMENQLERGVQNRPPHRPPSWGDLGRSWGDFNIKAALINVLKLLPEILGFRV